MNDALRKILRWFAREETAPDDEEEADALAAYEEAARLWHYAPAGSKPYYADLVEARRQALHAVRTRHRDLGARDEHRPPVR